MLERGAHSFAMELRRGEECRHAGTSPGLLERDDALFDLVGDLGLAVDLFRRLCCYYYFLDPEATAYYVHRYREM